MALDLKISGIFLSLDTIQVFRHIGPLCVASQEYRSEHCGTQRRIDTLEGHLLTNLMEVEVAFISRHGKTLLSLRTPNDDRRRLGNFQKDIRNEFVCQQQNNATKTEEHGYFCSNEHFLV